MKFQSNQTELGISPNGQIFDPREPQGFLEDYDSNCSTPYVSAPSSPGRAPAPGSINGGFYYSAPASPMHFAMTSSSNVSSTRPSSPDNSVPSGYEFEFSGRFGSSGSGQTGSMTSADELFLNGKIRPMKLSTHLERPQVLAPLMDLEHEDDDDEDNEAVDNNGRGGDLRLTLKAKSLRRRTRSMSPLRNATLDEQNMCLDKEKADSKNNDDEEMYNETSASMSASSSRSSSAGRNSKRWVFLKDFLRSKSEGTGRSNNKFWSTISFSPTKEKKSGSGSGSGAVIQQQSKEKLSNVTKGVSSTENQRNNEIKSKPVNGIGKGKGKGKGKWRVNPPSPHELLYTANRAQAEEMRKKTFLPYKQGLFECLSFSSKGYGATAMNGLARALNPVSSS